MASREGSATSSPPDANEASFRQLIVEDDHRYLQALNRDWLIRRVIEIIENAAICGVAVFKGEAV